MKLKCPRLKLIKISLIFTILIFSGNVLGFRAIPDNNLAYPVLILGGHGTGSGVFYKQDNKFYLVTARHNLYEDSYVSITETDLPKNLSLPAHLKRKLSFDIKLERLSFFGTMTQNEKNEIISITPPKYTLLINKITELFNASQILKLRNKKVKLISYPSDLSEKAAHELDVDFEVLNQANSILYNNSCDIAAVKIGKVIEIEDGKYNIVFDEKAIERSGDSKSGLISLNEQSLKKFDDILVGNEVYIFGYPTSLSISPEIDIKRPLLRRGVVAGKNEILKTIILDCPVFFGNSGGLVLEVEDIGITERRFKAIGIISRLVPFIKKDWMDNSGYSIAEPMDGLIELLSK